MFTSLEPVNGEKLFMGNSATSDIAGEGTVVLKMTSGKTLTLNKVLFVPDIRKNLISGSLLSKHGFRMVFESDRVILTKKAGSYVGKGYMADGLFKMNVMTVIPTINKTNAPVAYVIESSILWHGRLGHVNYESMRRLVNLDHIPAFHIDTNHKCETCVEAKLTRTSFRSVERSTEPLGLIHTDVCDLKYVQTPNANKYFITFIDDSTKYCYVYLLKSKDEALDKFILFKNEVENQLSNKIKVNGTAERKNRTLKEMMNAMLVSSGLPQNMCGEAMLTANYLLNLVPRKKLDKTPYELLKVHIGSLCMSLAYHTWELVDLPPGSKPLGYKWIFKRKMKADGSIDKYKARLVIKGYRQKEGLDYFDTYSPVSRINSIRMIIAIAALRNLEIHQMDVKTAFLNGDLEEEIYMEQPEGFSASGQEGKVCKLVRSLYGLKQAPKQWHEKFDYAMLSSGFRINECDKCVYVKDTDEGYVILCLYVDDMLIVGSNDRVIRSTKDMFNSKFDMKDMDLADVILGVKITRTSDGLAHRKNPRGR
ncbi:hypothetical protein Vadar_026696 [Vaccinium darrowii]|uniref:Uncharacterized protein n=1 Tax=Vaccinium darrowii TaxID=229202 RepID=A0ACB7ZFI4_9ERIC|nr:hypothetical protein Vadar_026696 [Vaccinium darrowii]